MTSIAPRFFAKVRRTKGCWAWTAGRDKDGYGKFSIGGESVRAHRVSWELHYGQIPDGLLVCHTCDNPPCVNPEHLFVGTNSDNMLDASAKGRLAEQQKRYCPSGHEYTAENTRIERRGTWTMRKCIECDRLACSANYAKNRAERIAKATEYARAQRAIDPEGFKQRQREYMRASRARKRAAANHAPPPT